MADIIHRVGIQAPISEVYAALSSTRGVAGWWTRETTGQSTPGGTISFHFRTPEGDELATMDMEVLALDADRRVHWRVRSGPEEWVGTDLTFDLSRTGEYTVVLFGHRNWREAGEFMAHCSMKWATFLLSLKQLVETGVGKPHPDDLRIDDWN